MLAAAVAVSVKDDRRRVPAAGAPDSGAMLANAVQRAADDGVKDRPPVLSVSSSYREAAPSLSSLEDRLGVSAWSTVRVGTQLVRESILGIMRVVNTSGVRWALVAGGVRFCAGYGVGIWSAPLFRCETVPSWTQV